MASFTDNAKREWYFALNCYELRRIKQRLGWGLLDRSYKDLAVPETLFDVLWVLLEKNATERQVSEDALGEALFGDAVTDAQAALLEALADFFPQRSRAPLLELAADLRTPKSEPPTNKTVTSTPPTGEAATSGEASPT